MPSLAGARSSADNGRRKRQRSLSRSLPSAPVKKAVVAPVPQPEPSFIDELTGNPLYLAAGAGLIILMGIFGLSAMRRRQAGAAAARTWAGPVPWRPTCRSGTFSG